LFINIEDIVLEELTFNIKASLNDFSKKKKLTSTIPEGLRKRFVLDYYEDHV